MRKILKILGAIIALVVVVAGIGVTYLLIAFPKVESAPDITIEATLERVARGAYLANHVTVCIGCHSTRDWQYLSGPPVPGTEGQGGDRYDEDSGFPGTVYASNITPAGIGDWNDGELIRGITMGVNRDGEALFPIMPYPQYRNLSEEDLYSIVVYLRTLPPIENEIPQRSLNFPMNLIVRTIPEPAQPKPHPDPTDTVAYGAYLAAISGCKFCHTPRVQGEKLEGMDFAGGYGFPLPGGTVYSTNITPDKETGIGGWDEESFIGAFKAYSPDKVEQKIVEMGAYNTVMPWTMYSGMREEDLGAIYDYLRTVPAVKNRVQRFVKR